MRSHVNQFDVLIIFTLMRDRRSHDMFLSSANLRLDGRSRQLSPHPYDDEFRNPKPSTVVIYTILISLVR